MSVVFRNNLFVIIQSNILHVVLIFLSISQTIFSSDMLTPDQFMEKINKLTFDVYIVNDTLNAIPNNARPILEIAKNNELKNLAAMVENVARTITTMYISCNGKAKARCKNDALEELDDLRSNTTITISYCFDFKQSQCHEEIESAKLFLKKQRKSIDDTLFMCKEARKRSLFVGGCSYMDYLNKTSDAIESIHNKTIICDDDLKLFKDYGLGRMQAQMTRCILPSINNIKNFSNYLSDNVEKCVISAMNNIDQESRNSRIRSNHVLSLC